MAHADTMLEHGQDEEIFLICRCLFENPRGWSPPPLGAPVPAISEDRIAKVSYFPLMFSKGVPFFVIEGYQSGGRNNPKAVLKMCESLQLRASDLPTIGYEAAAQALVSSEDFRQLYADPDLRRDMSKMVLRQAIDDAKDK
jgi:hypothetical protein